MREALTAFSGLNMLAKVGVLAGMGGTLCVGAMALTSLVLGTDTATCDMQCLERLIFMVG